MHTTRTAPAIALISALEVGCISLGFQAHSSSPVSPPLASTSFQGPVFSPDGKWLVFNGFIGGNYEIVLCASDGSQLRNLTHSPGEDRDPLWSPDGQFIFFVSSRDGTTGIYRMQRDGSDLHDLTPGTAHADFPMPSPDQHWLIYWQGTPHFKTGRDGRRYVERYSSGSLWIADFVGHNSRLLVKDVPWPLPAHWSPDAAWIAYSWREGTWLIHPDGSDRHKLTNRRFLAWAPDSHTILTYPLGTVVGLDGQASTDSGTAHLLRDYQPFGFGSFTRDPRLHWNPAGTRLAVTLLTTKWVEPRERVPNGLVLLDARGHLVADLRDTACRYQWDGQLSWSPDGQFIAVSYHEPYCIEGSDSTSEGIALVAASGSTRVIIVPDGATPP